MKRLPYFAAGVVLGVAATRRTRRAKEAAKAALAAKLTPSAIAADIADAVAELGSAVGAFATDVRMGAANRRASYRPMVDGANGSVVMVPPEHVRQIAAQAALAGSAVQGGAVQGGAVDGGAADGGAVDGGAGGHDDQPGGPARELAAEPAGPASTGPLRRTA